MDTPETVTGARYVLGHIDQTTHSLTIRLNVSLTPDLTIQYYGSPFVSSGSYTAFKKTTDTVAAQYEDRFHVYGPDEIAFVPEDNTYVVQEAEGGPGSRYSFGNPSFSFRQFRSNLVARWEYKPGSALYVVWSQGRTSDSDLYEDSLGQQLRRPLAKRGPQRLHREAPALVLDLTHREHTAPDAPWAPDSTPSSERSSRRRRPGLRE